MPKTTKKAPAKSAPKKAAVKSPQARGWDTRRKIAKKNEFLEKINFGKDRTATVAMDQAQREALEGSTGYQSTSTFKLKSASGKTHFELKDSGKIATKDGVATAQAKENAAQSDTLVVALEQLLNDLVAKLGGEATTGVTPPNPLASQLALLGALEHTNEKQREALNLVARISNLQAEML